MRIVNFCNMLDIIADEQNGFRAQRSCSDHSFIVTSLIRKAFSRKKFGCCNDRSGKMF